MHLNIKIFITVIVSTVLLISCSKEEIQSDQLNQYVFAPCQSCSYFPWCDKSTFTYIDSVGTNEETVEYDYRDLGDTIIDNLTYTASLVNYFNDTAFHLCDQNQTTVVYPDGNGQLLKYTLLKSDEPKGSTWRDSFPGNSALHHIDYTLTAKAFNWRVGSNNFSDVINVKETVYKINPNDTVINSCFYARNVGLIEKISTDNRGFQLYRRLISSYSFQ